MADEKIRAGMREWELPTFENPALTPAPPLKDATVAIVTTAGLYKPEGKRWKPEDPSFRVFDADDRDIQFGHLSPNLDYSGVAVDLNVMYPIDRLFELEQAGVIGKVAARHISFLGAQDVTMTAMRTETGPAAAKILKEDGTDVVFLTPV